MELRRAGEALLRSQPSLLYTLFTSSTLPYRRAIVTESSCLSPSYSLAARVSRRNFSLAQLLHQQGAAAAPVQSAYPTNDQQRPSQLDARDKELLDTALDLNKPTGIAAKHPSHFKSNRAQTTYGSSGGTKPKSVDQVLNEIPTGSSADMIAGAYVRQSAIENASVPLYPRPATVHGRDGETSTNALRAPRPFHPRQHQQNAAYLPTERSGPSYALDIGTGPIAAPEQPKKLHLTPSIGRSVEIAKEGIRGLDLGRGVRALEILCARNKVRHDFYKQRFHERGGLKRKRLRRERWRRRFKTGFKAALTRVNDLRKKGW